MITFFTALIDLIRILGDVGFEINSREMQPKDLFLHR